MKKTSEELTPKPADEKPEELTPKPADEKPEELTPKPADEKPEVIFVGNKPPMSYVLAIITALSSGANKEITLKARGRAITTAVDVAEITRNRFIKDLKVTKICIGTAEMPPREGENRTRMVSTMEITLSKA